VPRWLFEPPIRESARSTARAFELQSLKAVPPLLLAMSGTAVKKEQIRNEKSASIMKSNPLSID
jgi:hypothetical protein